MMIGEWEDRFLTHRNGAAILDVAAHRGAIGLDRVAWTRSSRFAKRLFDIVLSAAGLIALAPVLLATAAVIKMTSRGPVLFWQDRIGLGGAPFRVCKFRTMYADQGDPTGARHTVQGDPRVTPFGRFLRRRSIDELPQLLNVLKGEMSLVGPRAHAVKMVVCGLPYETVVGNYHLRHRVRPGITGLAQIRGLRGPVTDFDHARQRVEADLEYIRDFNVLLDMLILARTALQELRTGSGV